MAITIRDVARESKVSLGTVSRVLHNKDNVNPALKERVIIAIKRLGYDPFRNIPRKTHTIGLVLPWIITSEPLDAFYGQAVLSLKMALNEANAGFTLFSEQEVRERVANGFHREDLGADGLVFFCTNHRLDRELKQLKKWQVPCALIRRSTEVSDVFCISDSDAKGALQTMEHLYRLGHRRIALVSSGMNRGLIPGREAGYRQFINNNRLPDYSDFRLTAGGEKPLPVPDVIRTLMGRPPAPTAFVCYSDYLAITAIRTLQELGFSCPRQVSVAGWDDTDAGRHLSPALTTVRIPVREMASYAGRLIMERLEGSPVPVASMEFNNQLLVRESTGPCPDHKSE